MLQLVAHGCHNCLSFMPRIGRRRHEPPGWRWGPVGLFVCAAVVAINLWRAPGAQQMPLSTDYEDILRIALTLPSLRGVSVGDVGVSTLGGGLSNKLYAVDVRSATHDRHVSYVLRVAGDAHLESDVYASVHLIDHELERRVGVLAHRAGLSPEVIDSGFLSSHSSRGDVTHGVLVTRKIEGSTLSNEDVRRRPVLAQIVKLLNGLHALDTSTLLPIVQKGPVGASHGVV